MKNFLLITTGGSGGHVIPATVLYEHLAKEYDVIISTDKRGLNFLDQNLYDLEIIDTPKLNNIFLLPINLIKILYLTFKSFFLLRSKRVKKIFSTGGYMSLPIILAAKFLRLTIYLVEPNQVLGRANKFFLKSSKNIFCYNDKLKNFPNNFKNKMILINPLVKKKIYQLSELHKEKNKFTLLVVGGSQGANFFDGNLKNIIINIGKKNPISVLQQTNKKNISYLHEFYKSNDIENKIFDFDKDFSSLLKKTDLCITRSGASTLAELSVLNIPFIAVPLPKSKDNHQLENANFYLKKNCCWILEQNLFSEKIEQLIEEILQNKSHYNKKKENLSYLNYENTWKNVNQKILNNLDEN